MNTKILILGPVILAVPLFFSCVTDKGMMKTDNGMAVRTNVITITRTNLSGKNGPQGSSSFYSNFRSALRDELKNDVVGLNEYPDVLTVNIMDKVFFDEGKFNLKPSAASVLDKIGQILKDIPSEKVIQIEGHTDDVPIAEDYQWKIPNNWALGSRRAIAVALYLTDKFKIDPAKISVLSFSKYRPLVPNTSDANRAKNRRIEIVVLNQNIYQQEEIRQAQQKK